MSVIKSETEISLPLMVNGLEPLALSPDLLAGTKAAEPVEPAKHSKTTVPLHLNRNSNPLQSWSPTAVRQRARELLKIPDSKIALPFLEFFKIKANTDFSNYVIDSYLRRRRSFLEALVEGKFIINSCDIDGTLTAKTPVKVSNTRSTASLQDIYWLRLLILGTSKLGGLPGSPQQSASIEINTARPGVFAGQSVVSPEGIGGFRTLEEISSVLHEFGVFDYNIPENQAILNTMIINGLSSGLRHEPGQALKIQAKTIQFAQLLEFMNSITDIPGAEKGFTAKIEEICANRKENSPLRVLEYKAIPRIFIEQEFKLLDYVKYLQLAEDSRKKSWTTSQFINEFNKLNLKLPDKYAALLNPADPMAEAKLTAAIRDPMTVCFTPHALDVTNVERYDLKRQLYQTIADFTRHPSTIAWAKEKYAHEGPIFTINGKDVSHITDFNDKKQIPHFKKFISSLDKEGTPCSSAIMDNKDNNQFYIEAGASTSKDQSLPNYRTAIAKNIFTITQGDSPSTDAPMHAQAIINNGLAYKVRGLISPIHIGQSMVRLLADPKNAGHPDELIGIDPHTFQHKASGEIKSFVEWSEILTNKYKDRILPADNIHFNNAFNAAVFCEFFKDEPGFDFFVNPNADWVHDVNKNANKRTLSTPNVGAKAIAKAFPKPEKTREESSNFLSSIPIIKDLIAVKNTRVIFRSLISTVSYTLMGAGTVGIFAKLFKHDKLLHYSKTAQRWSYAINNFASGIGRGLAKQPGIRPTGQFWGEMLAFIANVAFPLESYVHKTLLAIGNALLQIGRGTEILQMENVNLDTHVQSKENDLAVDQLFGKDKEKFLDIREVAAKFTQSKTARAERYSKIFTSIPIIGKFVGRLMAESVSDIIEALKVFKEFISVPALNAGTFKAMFQKVGLAKISKVSGRTYQNVHSPGHSYIGTGILTLLSSAASLLTHKFAKKNSFGNFINSTLTAIENIIPTFGMALAARQVEQDVYGQPRISTDVNRQQISFVPETAGARQRFGAYMQAIAALFHKFDIGQLFFNMGTGVYLNGIRDEMQVALDDFAQTVGRRTRAEPYSFKEIGDEEQADEIVDFVKNFHHKPKKNK